LRNRVGVDDYRVRSEKRGSRRKPLPKLVLFMVIDGFPQEQLVKYYDQYVEGGFKLFLDRGAWYGNSQYSHANTTTSVGHATLATCAPVGSDWAGALWQPH
jgi:predicted AlkP superfamily pyrophosphatase or phosphodiesterase